MEKFTEFMTEVKKIRGLKTVVFEYDSFMDELIVKFNPKQFNIIDNDKSKMWGHFSDLLSTYGYSHDFILYGIKVYEEY